MFNLLDQCVLRKANPKWASDISYIWMSEYWHTLDIILNLCLSVASLVRLAIIA